MKLWMFSVSLFLTTIACKPNLFRSNSSTEESLLQPSSNPIDGQIKNAEVFVTEWAADFSCKNSQGSVTIETYRNERYLVRSKSTLCEGQKISAGWVKKTTVEYSDDAFHPKLVRVKEMSGVQINMNYAGSKIFCQGNDCRINTSLYGKNRCFLRGDVKNLVELAAQKLRKSNPNFSLYIHDCYRPIYVQQTMFEKISDPIWVASPKPPLYGGHNRGVAIDLTLASNGTPIDMGSEFDEFNKKSNYETPGITPQQFANRRLLREIMTSVGFKPYNDEWWHFFATVKGEEPFNFPI